MKNNDKIKFIKKLLYFLTFTLTFYLLFLCLWGSVLPKSISKNLKFIIGGDGYVYSRFQEADTIKNTDILFIGSSHVFRGYDPRIFEKYNLKIFTLGTNSQPPTVTKHIFENYINKFNPKLVVIDILPYLFIFDGVESELSYLSNVKPDFNNLELALKSKNIKVINTFLYSVFYHYSGLYPSYLEPKTKEYFSYERNEYVYDTYIKYGYVQTNLEDFFFDSKMYKKRNLIPTDENCRAFSSMINYLKKNNINYILVQAPVSQEFYNCFTNNKELNKEFSKYGHYYDFNVILNLSDKYFYDSNHLNQEGVNLYNHEFINILLNNPAFIQ